MYSPRAMRTPNATTMPASFLPRDSVAGMSVGQRRPVRSFSLGESTLSIRLVEMTGHLPELVWVGVKSDRKHWRGETSSCCFCLVSATAQIMPPGRCSGFVPGIGM
jgi:hypothetical protein